MGAQFLARKCLIDYVDLADPPEFLLLEILKKIDQPTTSNLEKLGYTVEAVSFMQSVLQGKLDTAMTTWMNSASMEEQKKWKEVLQAETTTIETWINHNHGEMDKNFMTGAISLIKQATRFIYRERPSVRDLISDSYFNELHMQPAVGQDNDNTCDSSDHIYVPPFEDVREALGGPLRRLTTPANQAEPEQFGSENDPTVPENVCKKAAPSDRAKKRRTASDLEVVSEQV